jgi:galactokinase
MTIVEKISQIYLREFQTKPRIFRAPGRINLIGEHTDYNGGFVLPAAIDKAAYIAISESGKATGKWISVDFNESVEISFENIRPVDQHWANYLLGIVDQFQKSGSNVLPFNCVLTADVPIGSGLSSSAALESAVAFALNKINNLQFERTQLASLAQRAENEFIGLKCGIMDMFASLHGKKDHVMRLDCRSLENQYFPLQLNQHTMMLLDTGVKHSLASSEYNIRREQCEEGVRLMQENHPEIQTLRDVSEAMLEADKHNLDPVVNRRCKFVLEENRRVFATCESLQKNDLAVAGKLMYASHKGLQNDYEVSCRELDLLVELVRPEVGVLGARMMGGGFGGCTINLVRESAVNGLVEKIAPIYEKETGRPLQHYEVNTSDGANELNEISKI